MTAIKEFNKNIDNNENMNAFVDLYNDLNNSFKKKCVFTVGHSAGFFSEINNMLYTMVYCMKHKIKFMPYAKTANFVNDKGWQEFFKPFSDEFDSKIMKIINFRSDEDVCNSLRNKPLKHLRFKIVSKLFKLKHNIDYLTYDVFSKVFDDVVICKDNEIKELGIKGDFITANTKFAKMIWRFNQQTQNDVDKIINALNLPEEYVSIHVRAGDKSIEFKKLIEVGTFMDKIKSKSDLKHIFVFADDYRQIEQLKNEYPDYSFYTICNEDETGYDNAQFQALKWAEKRPKILNLFANVNVCINSSLFIGSEQANPDLFIKMIMNENQAELLPAIFD